jgi:competence protein ComEA
MEFKKMKLHLVAAALLLAPLLVAPVTRCRAQPAQQPVARPVKPPPPPAERIDINRATIAELAKIPGLAPTWAARIVRFRPYRTKEDLLERGVLPSDVYDRIKNYVIAHRVGP